MPTGRKVTNVEEAQRLLRRYERSGQSMSEWCRRHGINRYSLSAFKGWSRRNGVPEFVEVEVVDEVDEVGDEVAEELVQSGPVAACLYRIGVGNRISIEVTDRFREDTLRRLLNVVSSC